MHQLNNLDVIILIIVGISALIAFSRGLMKEVLSIAGWILATATVVNLMPVFTPIVSIYIKSGTMAGIVTALSILILFFIFWILFTGKIVSKIKSSKLSNVDRFLGLCFGVIRASLLVVLFNILVTWAIPQDKQADVLVNSKYFRIAGSFAKPIENLIPESTLKIIKEKAEAVGSDQEKAIAEEEKEEDIDKNHHKNDANDLFEKLTQPQIKKKKSGKDGIDENLTGYKDIERNNLDRLIENAVD